MHAGWLRVRDEVAAVISNVSDAQMATARTMFDDRSRRWFCSGQGRSGLVARMVAMRLMHAGLIVHAVGESTAPAIVAGDGLLLISATGETPITIHLAQTGISLGAELLAVTARATSTLGRLANATITVPTVESVQFGGSLFEQSALLLVDGLILEITGTHPATYCQMQGRHANLQ
jgi:6-phospho-3-hexuloisomerase